MWRASKLQIRVDNRQLTIIESVLEMVVGELGTYESRDCGFEFCCAELQACTKPSEGVLYSQ